MQLDLDHVVSRIPKMIRELRDTPLSPKQQIATSQPIPKQVSNLTIDEQVAYYRSQLAYDLVRYQQSESETVAQALKYVSEATKIHKFGDRRVNIFAPFVMTRSALQTVTRGQQLVFAGFALTLIVALVIDVVTTAVAILGLLTLFYFGNLLLTFMLSLRTMDHSEEIQIPNEVVHALDDAAWPAYTILCPLYRETEVVQQFAGAMNALDYPVEKLQILFLTEDDDEATREAIKAANLPAHFQVITVPDGQPRTKPRACNYGLLETTGDFLVIFDAEDMPDPFQLKKAVLAFYNRDASLGCVQAKLNFYNSDQNILTRLFTAEYSTWFEVTLPGLQSGRFSLPLGGTSNHFRVSTLREVGGWDAYNVTEDCDLGLRLSSFGLNTVVLDSTTYEEANPKIGNWIRQRSRWIKGYFQTYLVHMRNPRRYLDRSRFAEFASLQLIVGGRMFVLLINPIMWLTLIIYALFRVHVESLYETLFPGPILYMAVICFVMGNLMYIYTHFIGCLKRRRYELIKWSLLMPFYWVLGSYAALKALWQLITKPHHWEKTVHGLHLNKDSVIEGDAPNGKNNTSSSNSNTVGLNKRASGSQSAQSTLSMTTEAPSTNGHLTNGHHQAVVIDLQAEYASGPSKNGAAKKSRLWVLRKRWPADPWLLATVALACIAGFAAIIYFFLNHQILLYNDSSSHLGISRLLFDNAHPGLAHLGGVWLPLPHLAMMPFTMVDFLWRTGLAGACVSMPSFVITAVYIFLTIRRLTHDSRAAFIGALISILNPNLLYLQATPLTEVMATATIIGACYHLLAWVQEDDFAQLLLAAAVTFLACLTRYDGWALYLGFLAFVPFVSLLKRHQRSRIEANTIIFALLGGLGIVIWISWTALILGDALFWQRSEFSAQEQQQIILQAGDLYTYHQPLEAVRYMSVLAAETLGWGLFVVSIIGLVVFFVSRRPSLESLASLTVFVPFAFYIFSLYSGQITMSLPGLVPPDTPNPYFNTRYGIIFIPPGAIFTGIFVAYILSLFSRWSPVLARIRLKAIRRILVPLFIIGILGQSVFTAHTGVVALQDGQFGQSCSRPSKIADYMAQHYSSGKILIDFFSNSSMYTLGPVAGVEFKNLVYQGTGSLWIQALDKPASVVDWIILDPQNPRDKVAKAIDPTAPRFLANYTLAVEDGESARVLYRRNTLPELPARAIRPGTTIANHLCTG